MLGAERSGLDVGLSAVFSLSLDAGMLGLALSLLACSLLALGHSLSLDPSVALSARKEGQSESERNAFHQKSPRRSEARTF